MSRMLRRAMFNVVLYTDSCSANRAVCACVRSGLVDTLAGCPLPEVTHRGDAGGRRSLYTEQVARARRTGAWSCVQPESRFDRLLIVKPQLSTLETSCRLLQARLHFTSLCLEASRPSTCIASARGCAFRTARWLRWKLLSCLCQAVHVSREQAQRSHAHVQLLAISGSSMASGRDADVYEFAVRISRFVGLH
ncbi:hypothetical protein K466DRAFT_253556 [Polyporus arcularius HHB13444]|uniref:Uncharacterized protein n=1 Tax=Polyporus arcularius HHB13444 TaxID=1314778 RepID=A0A5C3P204_9APHY|nr:hypothetical protein K466DRAFT_253556 [Polyporus arcularius HHB13444]